MKQFQTKFNINNLLIKDIDNWIISLRPKQVTLGSLIISLKRECLSISKLTLEEESSLGSALKEAELLLREAFNPQIINFLALMMVDHQVHFHVIPRYDKGITYNQQVYLDYDWPNPPTLSNTINIDDKELFKLKDYLMNI